MKTCALQDFMEELKPWLDQDHIRRAEVDARGRFTLYFNDGMKNVYAIDDCVQAQLAEVVQDLRRRGIEVEES
ncbi:cell division protein FtsQ [Desulfurivibrio alkaliphilus]|uniref:Putative periplasmic protein n=1 Tax=Desulfurivibrio alkaliphilus (strain DSM 19089 / UNIQEM U267 / AHT2) TaxID=589865 RepID=D6Z6Q9_DESAT|nr:cell division protein FtsQ [Desulfurivibrio alkaliphilus]ADH85018.1 putative periplasmic protein [Desulfurivibrio alkaliphilus AHT 2]